MIDKKLFLYAIFFLSLVNVSKCAKILGVFPFPARSHYILGNGLMKGLAEKGHDVTMISPHVDEEPPRNGSYRTIHLNGFWEKYFDSMKELDLMNHDDENKVKHPFITHSYMLGFEREVLEHPNMQKFLKSDESFDLVIVEKFYNDAFLAFAHHFETPLVLFSAIGSSPCTNPMMGNPEPFSYLPHYVSSFPSEMSFFQRLTNSYLYLFQEVMDQIYFLPKHEETMRHYFKSKGTMPSIHDLFHNASLLFTSTHESFGLSAPLVPNVVPIGGFHVRPPKKLPKELQGLLDGSKHGVVYMSFGSNLKINEMPPERQEAIFDKLGMLKEDVLVKWDGEVPKFKPDNVHLRKWWPQSDLLAHPNVKLFVTHAGLLSVTETIYHGVPVLLIPFFADQHYNAQLAVSNGYGLKLPYSQFSAEKLFSLMKELLQNSSYRDNAQRRSRVFHDRPQKPMDVANFWVEYVIRHQGAPHLRVKGVDIPWYKYFLIDIILFVSAILSTALYLIILVIKRLTRRQSQKVKVKKS